jgi:hypothetical protein
VWTNRLLLLETSNDPPENISKRRCESDDLFVMEIPASILVVVVTLPYILQIGS